MNVSIGYAPGEAWKAKLLKSLIVAVMGGRKKCTVRGATPAELEFGQMMKIYEAVRGDLGGMENCWCGCGDTLGVGVDGDGELAIRCFGCNKRIKVKELLKEAAAKLAPT